MVGRTVACMGDSVADVLVQVPNRFLEDIGAEPGGCIMISAEEMQQLMALAAAHGDLVRTPGGSAANVAKGIAHLCPSDTRVRFVSMVGADAAGEEFRQGLAAAGVEPLLLESPTGLPTSTCLCMVTPDGQRTMRTSLSASKELTSIAQLPGSWLDDCRWLHCEGYCLYKPELTRDAMLAAKARQAQVSLDLASFELVRNSAAALQGLLAEGLVDVVLANEEEAQAFSCVASGDEAPAGSVAAAAHAGGSCGSTLDEQPQCSEDSRDETAQTAVEALAVPAASKPFVDSAAADGVPMAASNGVSASDGGGAACGGDYAAGSAPAARSPGSPAGEDLGFFGPAAPPGVQQAQDLLLRHCRVSIVSLGEAGCLARDSEGNSAFTTAESVRVVDTVGAGDNCTAAAIAALLQSASLQAAVECGCAAGTAAVQAAGGVLGGAAADALRECVQSIIAGSAS